MARLYTLIFLALILGCQKSGGGSDSQPVTPANYGDGLATEIFVRVACSKLNSCFDSLLDCSSQVLKLTNIDAEIGISPGGYRDLSEMVEAERKSDLRPNAAPHACFPALDALNCKEARVQGAYIPGNPEPLRGLADMIPEVCHDLFGI